jgi:TPR repeat protein
VHSNSNKTQAPVGKTANAMANRQIKDKWAVVIGIDRFKDPTIPHLQFPAKDASDFAQFLTHQGNFAEDHVLLLTNENATRDKIRDAIGGNWLPRRVDKDDLVLIYASTHGSPRELDVAGENFLVAYDSEPENLYVTGIRFSDLAPEIKERTGCDRVVLLLDACNSGAATVGGKGLVRTTNFDVGAIAGEGQIVISSSASNQRSFESKRYENGVFTKQLMDALQCNSQNTTIDQAFDYLKEQVETEVRFDRQLEQTPVMRSKWSGGELILLAVPAQPRHVPHDVNLPTVNNAEAQESYKQAHDFFNQKNYVAAVPLALQAANAGNASAQNLCGMLCEKGLGQIRDLSSAAQWYQKAAQQDCADAQANLASLYQSGQGVPQNLDKAFEWYQRAATNGSMTGEGQLGYMYELGNATPQNYEEAAKWYQKAADQGDEWAQCQMGKLYAGGNGVPQNFEKAVEWYRKAADQNGRCGNFYLAVMYAMGRGVPQNYAEAARLYERSAILGEPTAQNNLAHMYEIGQGVKQNYTTAAQWYQKSADNGQVLAMCNLANLYCKGLGVGQDLSKARALLQAAASRGFAPAAEGLKHLPQ